MKHFYLLIGITTLGLWSILGAQTVVKMPLPQQAELPLTVEILFDEALPANIPSAIGIMGYDVSGGTAPYSYAWLENETLLQQGETLLLQPADGKTYALRITDKNNCTAVAAIAISGDKNSDLSKEETSGPQLTLTRQLLWIQPPGDFEGSMDVYLLTVQGQRLLHARISAETEIPLSLPPGSYILLLKYDDQHYASKHLFP